MNEAQIIEGIALIADHETAKIAQPGEEPFDLPAAAITAERATILRFGAHTPATMWSDHLHPELGQCPIESIGIIGAISNESPGHLVYKAGVEGGRDEGDLVRRSRGGTDGERKTSAVCHRPSGHELRTFAPLGRSHTSAPFFATTKVPSMKHSDK